MSPLLISTFMLGIFFIIYNIHFKKKYMTDPSIAFILLGLPTDGALHKTS